MVDCFFSRLDCVYGVQSSMCSCLFFFKCIIFHIIYLYSTPLCPFSDKRLDLFPGFMKLLLQKYAMGWDWLAGSVCCDSLNCLYYTSERPAPHLSGMCSGWIVNSGDVYQGSRVRPIWSHVRPNFSRVRLTKIPGRTGASSHSRKEKKSIRDSETLWFNKRHPR